MGIARLIPDHDKTNDISPMSEQLGFSPMWYRAITLGERIALLHGEGSRNVTFGAPSKLAIRRLQLWRSQPPFVDDSIFAQRLAADRITEDEFVRLLDEPAEAVLNHHPGKPRWLTYLFEVFTAPTSSHSTPHQVNRLHMAKFLHLIEPLLKRGRDRLHEGVQELARRQPSLPFDPQSIEDLLLPNLLPQLIEMLSRTLALELNVNRVEGNLDGDTPEVRFESFIRFISKPDKALALLQEYPVLARQLIIRIDQWATFGVEFLGHLCADWEQVKATFCGDREPGILVSMVSTGDPHHNGRSVVIVGFGSGHKVVYKPRPTLLDVHFQDLLTWLADRGYQPSFRTLKILDRGTYGWCEFVEAQACKTHREIRHFYERLGGYLALLYTLEATDFHGENILASGEHPMLIDLEALFHPRAAVGDSERANELAINALDYSVLRVGLLPQRLLLDKESEGVDFSGLGAMDGQFTPFGVPLWEKAGTDEMRFTRGRVRMLGWKNRPSLDGNNIDPFGYVDSIVGGFTLMYKFMLMHRDELLSDKGPLKKFNDDGMRFICRPTQIYGQLLYEGFHPDVLRNALDRDRLFDQLWMETENSENIAAVISAEREDLWNNDIPLFSARPSSRDLYSSTGRRIADFFGESGMGLARLRLQQLSDEDLSRQIWFIRGSLMTLSRGAVQTPKITHHRTIPHTAAKHGQLLAAARAVGDRLETLAFRGKDDIAWLGLTSTDRDEWSLMPLGSDLYAGIPGVALFLAHLGAITCEERYTELAQTALVTLLRQIKQDQREIKSIGGFVGWGGIIYTLTHLSALWNEASLLAEVEGIVEQLPPLIDQDDALDIIGGAAGCLGSLISLQRYAPSDQTLTAAIRCGDRLVSRATPMEQGIGWVPRHSDTRPLTGLSHGAAGIAWVLLELASLTGYGHYRNAALAGIDYERSLFSARALNWPDLREFGASSRSLKNELGEKAFMVAWCHGAPGIGLSRLCMLRQIDDPEIRFEIKSALRTTLAQGFGGNHSLCHGDLGNLELLIQAAETFDDSKLNNRVNDIAAVILDSIGHDGWLCGNALVVESPGLMTGLAGIGYGLLRLAEPARIPSILILAPPSGDHRPVR